jgi:hypothetical protein
MANTFAPRGLLPLKRNDGAMTNFAYSANNHPIASGYATNIFWGDPVKLVAAGTLQLAAAGDQIRGIFQGCNYKNPAGDWIYSKMWTASATYVAGSFSSNIIDDPNMEFQAQWNGSSVPALADQGALFNHQTGSGTAATGLSTIAMDYSTLSTSTGTWRYLRPVTRPDNDTTTANFWGVFAPALHDFRVNTGI